MEQTKVQFGLSNAHYAVITTDPVTGEKSYGVPKKLMCSTSLSLTPVGSSEPFFCDDRIGYTSISNQGYEGTLTGAMLSDSFREDVLREKKDSNGMRVEYTNVQPAEFALLFEVNGDPEQSRFVLWNCKASRPSQNHTTQQESITVDEQELAFTAQPREDYAVKGHVTSGDAPYTDWFKSVPEPATDGTGE